LDDQFHPSYTRMVPAHYITTIELLGCPDPNPVYDRFFAPERNIYSPQHPEEIGASYIGAVYQEIKKWLQYRATSGPIGVTFSAGIDSGSVFMLTYHALKELGQSPSRLKAFTLGIDGDGADLLQARRFLEELGLELFLEPVEADYSSLIGKKAIKLLRIISPGYSISHYESGFICRNPFALSDWKYLIDGEGGDENLKDYPIEENPELTIRSVLNNLMLYHEGWGLPPSSIP